MTRQNTAIVNVATEAYETSKMIIGGIVEPAMNISIIC
jgi:hypothetical protein